jgi:hypothetical protein
MRTEEAGKKLMGNFAGKILANLSLFFGYACGNFGFLLAFFQISPRLKLLWANFGRLNFLTWHGMNAL